MQALKGGWAVEMLILSFGKTCVIVIIKKDSLFYAFSRCSWACGKEEAAIKVQLRRYGTFESRKRSCHHKQILRSVPCNPYVQTLSAAVVT